MANNLSNLEKTSRLSQWPANFAKRAKTEFAYREVLTAHPTHAQTQQIFEAHQQLRLWFEGALQTDVVPDIPDELLEAITCLAPPPIATDWKKPELVTDEIPLIATAISNHVEGFLNDLEKTPNDAHRTRLANAIAKPAVWGAYDQDGHPDASPGLPSCERRLPKIVMARAFSSVT